MTTPDRDRFLFAIPRPWLPLVALFGAGPGTAWVLVDDAGLEIRFGLWVLRTPLDNVAGAEVTGPFTTLKALGVRLSAVDRGITFGTNGDRGVCVRFRRPVPAADPFGLLRHPGATVTVADPGGLVAAIERRRPGLPGCPDRPGPPGRAGNRPAVDTS